jgi:hypothetical protein
VGEGDAWNIRGECGLEEVSSHYAESERAMVIEERV